jgi:hypothetical protein
MEIMLGASRQMILSVGHHMHIIHWAPPEIVMEHVKQSSLSKIGSHVLEYPQIRATSQNLPPWVRYDPKRFTVAGRSGVIVVGDAFGQVSVFDGGGRLVCMFFVFRDQIAAWMPDGTRHGPASIVGGPSTPGALKKIGMALRAASIASRSDGT